MRSGRCCRGRSRTYQPLASLRVRCVFARNSRAAEFLAKTQRTRKDAKARPGLLPPQPREVLAGDVRVLLLRRDLDRSLEARPRLLHVSGRLIADAERRIREPVRTIGRGVPGVVYTGEEPSSIHHTTYTIELMSEGRLKWWYWLGEESHSGGVIGRYESGYSRTNGLWRPSEHSIMRWSGSVFDGLTLNHHLSGWPSSPISSVMPSSSSWRPLA